MPTPYKTTIVMLVSVNCSKFIVINVILLFLFGVTNRSWGQAGNIKIPFYRDLTSARALYVTIVYDKRNGNPSNLFVDSNDNIYISYQGDIKRITSNGTTTTIAGTVEMGYNGDNILATKAQLNNPRALFADTNGNMFIADRNNHRIRKITPDGIITTIAGNGNKGYAGDDGLAIGAKLNQPTGIFVDKHNNLFIADTGNNRIRKVSPDGIITTAVGNGEQGYFGDRHRAEEAQLYGPTALFIDQKGSLFFTDTENHSLRKVSPDGIITTIAGDGNKGFAGDDGLAIHAQLNQPRGIFVDADDNLFIADYGNHRIRKVLWSQV